MKTKKGLFIAFALLFIQIVIALETTIEVPLQNFPPQQLQNIPDQSWPMNINNTDAFDLDDYFIDYEDFIVYNFTNVENITIIINSTTNVVSFYSDAGFTGVRNVTFIASDGFSNTSSNLVFLNVTTDFFPPLWHEINMSPTSVSQNTVVNFQVNWTDNIGLAYFIFSINEGGGWANYTELFSGKSNISSHTMSITAAGATNVLWLVYAYDTSGNFNYTDTQFFTVNSPPSSENDDDDDSSSSSKASRGGTTPQVSQTRAILKGFEVIPDNLAVELKQGESITKLLKINNLALRESNFTIEIDGLDDILFTSQNNFSIKSGSSAVLALLFQTTRKTVPDIYFGKVKVRTLTERVDVPIIVTVNPLVLEFEVKLELDEKYKLSNPGEEVEGRISLFNKKDFLYENVTLYYSIMNVFGEMADYNEEVVQITDNVVRFNRNLTLPGDTEQGDYIFYVRASKDNKVSMDLEEFIVGKRFNLFSFIMGNILYIIIAIVFVITLLLFIYYHKTKEKERLLNLYIMINELKKLIEEGKMEEAIMQYNRIKLAYHEKIDKTQEQNKEDLKKEMQELIVEFNMLKNVKKLKEEINNDKKTEVNKDGKEAESQVDESKEDNKADEKQPEEKKEVKNQEKTKKIRKKQVREKKKNAKKK